jgi:hypothetical protein
MTIKFTWEDEEGCEHKEELPGRYEVCERCRGRGVHDHEAFSDGITAEDFAEDPDFAEQYHKGWYDVPCSVCHGRRVVLVPEEENLSDDQKEALDRYWEKIRADAEFKREMDYARRMGF